MGGECFSANECCTKIQGEYPKPDINGNDLQCYEWVLPTTSVENTSTSGSSGSIGSTGSVNGIVSDGVPVSSLVIHLKDNKVALPAVITGGIHELVQDEENSVTQQTCPKSFPNDLVPDYRGIDVPITLQDAVKSYVDQNCDTDSNCAIGVEYGWPINSWCVEKVTSFGNLFQKLATFNEDEEFWSVKTFNEDINGWTTSQVCVP